MYVTMISAVSRGIHPSGNERGPLSDENADEEKKNVDFMTPNREVWQMLGDVPNVPRNLWAFQIATLQGL